MAQSTSQVRRVLVVSTDSTAGALESELLSRAARADVVSSIDAAVRALQDEVYDHVLATPAAITELARAGFGDEVERVFAEAAHPVFILTSDGALSWGNRRFESYPPEIREALRVHVVAAINSFSASIDSVESWRGRQSSIDVDRQHFFDVSLAPLLEPGGGLERMVAVVWDVSRARRLQATINALDAAGREIVEIDTTAIQKWDTGERLQLLEEKIINVAHDLLHFDHFIVRILDKKDGRLEPVLAAGLPDEAVTAEFRAEAEGHGISGYVAATGRSYICADVSRDPRYKAGLDRPGSSLTVPLMLHDRVIGVLNVESHEVNAFAEDDRQFAEIFGHYIAIALHILNLLVVERHTTTGQIAADVNSESAAALNDIVRDVSSIMDDFADEGLRARLRTIIADVDKVREAIHSVTDPNAITGLVPEAGERDPLIHGRSILIVDDEEIIRETISDVLTRFGARTRLADDGERAVELLEHNRYDLVLSDIKMPNRNGYEVFAAARRSNPDCGVILMTGFGYDPNHAIVRASREGLSGVLFKPFKVEKLLDDVRAALSHPRGD